ncbi:hypothetical protein ACU4HD_47050 [Cupriavidus basilensis]
MASHRPPTYGDAALDVAPYLVDEDKVDAEVEPLAGARATVRTEVAALKRDPPHCDVPERRWSAFPRCARDDSG